MITMLPLCTVCPSIWAPVTRKWASLMEYCECEYAVRDPEIVWASAPATLIVLDTEDPVVDVLSPDGGEFWLLSDASPDVPANPEFVAWSASDDIRVCSVDVALEYSDDGGQSWVTNINHL